MKAEETAEKKVLSTFGGGNLLSEGRRLDRGVESEGSFREFKPVEGGALQGGEGL